MPTPSTQYSSCQVSSHPHEVLFMQAIGLGGEPQHQARLKARQLFIWLKLENSIRSTRDYSSPILRSFKSFVEGLPADHTINYRSGKLNNTFPDKAFQPGNGIRDFLFCSNLNFDQSLQVDTRLAQLRLFFIVRSLEFTFDELLNDANLDYIGQHLSKALNGQNKETLLFLKDFVDLDTQYSINLRLEIWLSRLLANSQDPNYENTKTRTTLVDFTQKLKAVLNGIYSPPTKSGAVKYFENTSLPRSELISILNNGFERPNRPSPESLADSQEVENAKDYSQKRIQANTSRSKRISSQRLTLGPHCAKFWPPEVQKLFKDHLNNGLKSNPFPNTDTKTNFLCALVLLLSSKLGITFREALLLPIVNEPGPTYGRWNIWIKPNGTLSVLRDRPRRKDGIRLSHSFEKYCFPLAEFIQISLPADQFGLYSTIPSKKQDLLSHLLSNLRLAPDRNIEDFLDQTGLESFILGELASFEFFSEDSIMMQAYSLLSSELDPMTAELCLAIPEESTSAVTGYCCRIENLTNVAGSELALTQEGASRLVREVTQKSLSNLKEVDACIYKLFSSATARITLASFMLLGTRASNSVLENLQSLCLNRKLVLIEDKRVEGLEELRASPILPQLLGEIEQYLFFLRSFENLLCVPEILKDLARLILQGSQRFPFAPDVYLENDRVELREHSVMRILESVHEDLGNQKTIFRHFLAQQVFEQSGEIELAMAFLGHSDSVRLLYGPCSTRSRKADLTKITEILEKKTNTIFFDTENYWKTLGSRVNQLRANPTDKAHDSLPSEIPFGRKRRAQEREKVQADRVEQLEIEMEKFEKTMISTSASANSPSITFLMAKEFLTDFEREFKLPKNEAVNKLLEKRRWGLTLSTFRSSQQFFDENLLVYLNRRQSFKVSYSKFRESYPDQIRCFIDLVYCIYFLGLDSEQLALNATDPDRCKAFIGGNGDCFIEISRYNLPLTRSHGTQAFRLPVPERMLKTIGKRNLNDGKLNLNKILKDFPSLRTLGGHREILHVITSEARQISRFEKPGYLQYAIASKPCPVSSDIFTLGAIEGLDFQKVPTNSPVKKSISAYNSLRSKVAASTSETQYDSNLTSLRNLLNRPYNADFRMQLEGIRQNAAQGSSSTVTLIEWIDFSLKQKQRALKPKSLRRYLSSVEYFLSLCPNGSVEEIETDCLDEYIKEFEQWTVGKSDRRIHHAGLRRFFDFLGETLAEEFVDAKISFVSSNKHTRSNWITPIQFNKTLKFLGNQNKDLHQKYKIILICLLYRFGLRIEEALGLKFGDLYFLDSKLLGLVVRKNEIRDIKCNRPPRYIFLQCTALSSTEEGALKELQSKLQARQLESPKDLPVFDLSSSELNCLCNSLVLEIRESSGNKNATFHSLRKGFAQLHLSNKVALNIEFRKQTGMRTKEEPPNSRAFSVLQRHMGHSRFSTTVENYVHTIDEILKNQTKGHRRGVCKEEEMPKDIRRLTELASGNQSRTSTQPSDQPNVPLTENFAPSLLACIKTLIQSGEVKLPTMTFSLIRKLLSTVLGFHQSSVVVTLNQKSNKLKLLKYSHRQTSFADPIQFQELLGALKRVEQIKPPESNVASIQEISAKNGQLIFSSEASLNLLLSTGLKKKDFFLEYPSDLSNIHIQRLENTAAKLGLNDRLRATKDPIANETTDEARSARVRLRFKWAYSARPMDSIIVFLCAFLCQARL